VLAIIQPVILCGGSGKRLWPLSRKALPKQFVPLSGSKSLLQLTLERVKPLAGDKVGMVCVGAEEHRFLIRNEMQQAGVAGPIILEPCARNTAAAMALAALSAAEPGQLMLFCPSDHHVPDAGLFAGMVHEAAAAAREGSIVTFGVVPTHPSTAYGYIEKGEGRAGGAHRVSRFVEKPDQARAQELLLAGQVLWNAGIFLCKASTLLAALERHAPDILAQCRKAMTDVQIDQEFIRPAQHPLDDCRSESIDYAVMEHFDDVLVYPFTGIWSDVGSWNAVAELHPADAAGNRIDGHGVALGASNNFIHAPARCVVALGTTDLIIVDTPDAVLVAKRDAVEQVKSVVDHLEARGSPEAVSHRKVARPWGSYDSIESGPRFQVKRICVNPGASISLQKHYHRSEHWVVVRGTAEVTRGSETFLVAENESTYIPLGEVHRLRNPGRTMLEIIEVQSGTYLGEDDIVRIQDNYGRAQGSGGS